MNINIRPVKIEDAQHLNKIRTMDGVRENILGITSERLAEAEARIRNLSPNHHMYVAEIAENEENKVVGTITLVINHSPRTRHSGSIGIMVHKGYQGNGIGKALMEKVIDLADNWLMLVRLELGVFVDNEKALKLYKSCGFEIEGRRKYAAIKNGKYEDEYIMARYNI